MDNRFLAQWIDRICSGTTLNLAAIPVIESRAGEPISWGESGLVKSLIVV